MFLKTAIDSLQSEYQAGKMTASRSGSPLLRFPLRVKCARVTNPGLMSAELESVDFLIDIASSALQLDLQAAAAHMRAEEWVKRGGLMVPSFVPCAT